MDIAEQIRKRIEELNAIQATAQEQLEQARTTMNGCSGAIGELTALLEKIKEAAAAGD
jgi:signal transduction histidine kinase